MRRTPLKRWKEARDEIRAAAQSEGYDERGVLVQAFGRKALDAALLPCPPFNSVLHGDKHMIRTVGAIREELDKYESLLRYRPEKYFQDGLEG